MLCLLLWNNEGKNKEGKEKGRDKDLLWFSDVPKKKDLLCLEEPRKSMGGKSVQVQWAENLRSE